MHKNIVCVARKNKHKESKGCLSKGWYNILGTEFLIKGNSEKDGMPHFEPYSEVIACKIAKALGLDAVEYTLNDASFYPDIKVSGIKHVSACKKIDLAEDEQLISFNNLMDLLHDETPRDYLTAYAKLGLNYKNLYRMLVFDALIGNEDRHLNNWDYIVSKNGIRPAPLLDHGASFMAMVTEDELDHCGDMFPDSSKTFEDSHYGMMELLRERHVENLFDVDFNTVMDAFREGIEEVRPYLSAKRISKIENYFELRAEVYLYPFIGKEKSYELEADVYERNYR